MKPNINCAKLIDEMVVPNMMDLENVIVDEIVSIV